jgi:multiple antibiotic resistance protein
VSGWLDAQLAISVFVTLFVIMDPPGTVPIFLALTGSMTKRESIVAARQAIAVAFGVIVGFALFGKQLLDYLNVSVAALQASGGLLLLFVAMELLTGKMDDSSAASVPDRNIAMVPLGTPLLAGPGAIVAVMVFVQQADGHAASWVAIALGVVLVHVMLYLAMRFADGVHRVLGDSGTMLLGRIAGLLLAAIAAQMIADGVIAFARTV